jgi:hypothetical protein
VKQIACLLLGLCLPGASPVVQANAKQNRTPYPYPYPNYIPTKTLHASPDCSSPVWAVREMTDKSTVEKFCNQCQTTKPVEEFHRRAGTRSGRASQCITCRQAYLARSLDVRRPASAKWKAEHPEAVKEHSARGRPRGRANALAQYGLTIESYDAMLTEQAGVCAICGRENASKRRLAVDHDHATGEVRGLLCNRCNAGIGLLGDTAEAVARAVVYLREAP